MPNLDRLARWGIVFANTLCAALLFSPSRVAVFSGRQPFHTGIYDNHDNILRLARSWPAPRAKANPTNKSAG